MLQGITNITLSLLEPNFTRSHNAVDHGDDISNSYSRRENMMIKPGKWMGQQAGEKAEYGTDVGGKDRHIFEINQQNPDFIDSKRLCEKLKEVIVHIPNILIYKLHNHQP